MRKSGITGSIHLITIDGVVRDNSPQAIVWEPLKRGPSAVVATFRNYYQAQGGGLGITGSPIPGADNINVTKRIQTKDGHTEIDNLLAKEIGEYIVGLARP
jgi:hypothetical protein